MRWRTGRRVNSLLGLGPVEGRGGSYCGWGPGGGVGQRDLPVPGGSRQREGRPGDRAGGQEAPEAGPAEGQEARTGQGAWLA